MTRFKQILLKCGSYNFALHLDISEQKNRAFMWNKFTTCFSPEQFNFATELFNKLRCSRILLRSILFQWKPTVVAYNVIMVTSPPDLARQLSQHHSTTETYTNSKTHALHWENDVHFNFLKHPIHTYNRVVIQLLSFSRCVLISLQGLEKVIHIYIFKVFLDSVWGTVLMLWQYQATIWGRLPAVRISEQNRLVGWGGY